jgi:hypothetical protein
VATRVIHHISDDGSPMPCCPAPFGAFIVTAAGVYAHWTKKREPILSNLPSASILTRWYSHRKHIAFVPVSHC